MKLLLCLFAWAPGGACQGGRSSVISRCLGTNLHQARNIQYIGDALSLLLLQCRRTNDEFFLIELSISNDASDWGRQQGNEWKQQKIELHGCLSHLFSAWLLLFLALALSSCSCPVLAQHRGE